DRLADLERGVPGGEHRQVLVVEIGDRLGVVRDQIALGDLVHPRAHHLADELPTRLTAHRLGDDADGVLGFDEAKGHCSSGARLQGMCAHTVPGRVDGKPPAQAPQPAVLDYSPRTAAIGPGSAPTVVSSTRT